MADPKTDDPGEARGSKKGAASQREAASDAQAGETERRETRRRTKRVHDPAVAFALGQISFEQLQDAKSRSARGAEADLGTPDLVASDMSFGMEEPMEPSDRPRKVAAASQAAAAMHRLRVAKDSGVLSRPEIDRAADMVLSDSPTEGVPTEVKLKTPRQSQAESIVQRHVLYAGGLNLFSFGAADILITPVLQLKMIQNLCSLYNVGFAEQWGKNIIATLLGTATAGAVGIRALPIVGILAAPISSGFATLLLGKVITQHLESGGTLLNFDPAKLKSYFAEYYQATPAVIRTAS